MTNWHKAKLLEDDWHPALTPKTIQDRLKRGWSVQDAISKPLQPNGGRKPESPWYDGKWSMKW